MLPALVLTVVIVLTAVGYSTVYDGKTHKASCTVCVTAGTTITL